MMAAILSDRVGQRTSDLQPIHDNEEWQWNSELIPAEVTVPCYGSGIVVAGLNAALNEVRSELGYGCAEEQLLLAVGQDSRGPRSRMPGFFWGQQSRSTAGHCHTAGAEPAASPVAYLGTTVVAFRISPSASARDSFDTAMPLKCINDGAELYAFNVGDDTSWESLRDRNKKSDCLKMPCCGSGVVLRTSKLGTRHFAHAKRGECSTAPETAEHLLAKMEVILGIQNASWTALPEQTSQALSGEDWRADVLAVQGNKRIAFEVQWSRQDLEETRRRQERYRQAGVRGLWLFRQIDFPVEKDTPAFRLSFDPETKAFSVHLPSPSFDPEWNRRNDTDLWNQTIPLPAFVTGALGGRLKFAPALGQRMPLEVHTAVIECWRCKRETKIVLDLVFAASRVFPKCPDIHTTIYDMAEHLDDGVVEVMAMLTPALLRQNGIGPVKMRSSKTEGQDYLSNGCVHCDSLQGRFYDHDHWYDAVKTLELEAEFQPAWGPKLSPAKQYIDRWWFDERTDILSGSDGSVDMKLPT